MNAQTFETMPAEVDTFHHCECGCGTSLHNREHVAFRRRYVWRAVDEVHAARIVARLERHPFEVVAEVVAML